jgi:2-polyprenyl-6-methoxyphenol hydroxylase-like FAD-dependent oxidoreductase
MDILVVTQIAMSLHPIPLYKDVVIVGGGTLGMTIARALQGAGFSVALIEKHAKTQNSVTQHGGKWFALGADVLHWFHGLGLDLPYQEVASLSLSCQGQDDPIILHAKEAQEPFLTGVVQSDRLYAQLSGAVACPDLLCPDWIVQWVKGDQAWHVTLHSGQELCTPLIVGADGGHSQVRAFFDPVVLACDFRQKAVVFQLDCVPVGWAYEHFFPNGSLAVLSLLDGKGAGIWIGPAKDVADLNIPDTVFAMLGITSGVLGGISIFDVHGHWASKKIFQRCVLVGDAACAIHPIAGQGLNLGLRHARLLVDQMIQRRRLGLDWGLGLDALSMPWQMGTSAMYWGTMGLVGSLCGVNGADWWKVGKKIMRYSVARTWLMRAAAGKFTHPGLLSALFHPFV